MRVVTDEVLEAMADSVSPQGIIAVSFMVDASFSLLWGEGALNPKLIACLLYTSISFFGPAASASVENASVTRTVVVVKHGETLWDIAQAVDPQGDTRDTVVRIMELNSLTSTSVDAGQRLEIPQTQR